MNGERHTMQSEGQENGNDSEKMQMCAVWRV